MSQNNNLIGVWIPGSFIEQRGKQARKSSQKAIYLAKSERDVFISSFLQPFTVAKVRLSLCEQKKPL